MSFQGFRLQSMPWALEELEDFDWRDYIAPDLLSFNP
jgi:hypothetical protein